ncbi:MAG: hypothetical protein KME12_24240 [Trichocoleus desertorum ATA4-8-CV12]|nr:hypothetical protein [Trichocoleus desertorum ATA4-8-CV12]
MQPRLEISNGFYMRAIAFLGVFEGLWMGDRLDHQFLSIAVVRKINLALAHVQPPLGTATLYN